MMSEPTPTLLEFPCSFPVKAMGRATDDFESLVSELILEHASLVEGEPIQSRPSKDGNYVSITAVIEAESQAQLDAIYLALTDCNAVLLAL